MPFFFFPPPKNISSTKQCHEPCRQSSCNAINTWKCLIDFSNAWPFLQSNRYFHCKADCMDAQTQIGHQCHQKDSLALRDHSVQQKPTTRAGYVLSSSLWVLTLSICKPGSLQPDPIPLNSMANPYLMPQFVAVSINRKLSHYKVLRHQPFFSPITKITTSRNRETITKLTAC